MLKTFKDIFSDETEVIDPKDIEMQNDNDEIDDSFKVDEPQSIKPKVGKSIVKIYEPVTKSATSTIIDSIKRGELCIVNFSKVSDEEAKVIYSTLSGSIYSLDGALKMIDSNIMICAPTNFLVDSDISE